MSVPIDVFLLRACAESDVCAGVLRNSVLSIRMNAELEATLGSKDAFKCDMRWGEALQGNVNMHA